MPTKLPSSLVQKLLFYGVSAGAVSLAASARAGMLETTAGISGNNIYFDPSDGATSLTDTTLPFSLTTTVDTKTSNNGTVKTQTYADVDGGVALNSTNYVIKSPSPVDGTQTYGNGPINVVDFNSAGMRNPYATFQPGDEGTIGLRYMSGADTDYAVADITFNGFGAAEGTFTLNSITAVPEPSSMALLVAGAAGAAVWRRRRQAARDVA